jgi:hypothetical protein
MLFKIYFLALFFVPAFAAPTPPSSPPPVPGSSSGFPSPPSPQIPKPEAPAEAHPSSSQAGDGPRLFRLFPDLRPPVKEAPPPETAKGGAPHPSNPHGIEPGHVVSFDKSVGFCHPQLRG